MVIAGFPQNPTGFMPNKAYASEMIEIVTNSGALLISDEIYAGLPPAADISGSNLADLDSRIISLNGLSKTYGLPGLRVGWIASQNQEAMSAIQATRDLFNAYTPAPIEILATIALENKDILYKRNASIITSGTAAATEFFQKHDDLFEWKAPKAGVLSFPKWLGPGGARNLSERLIEDASIALAPGECFDAGDNHLRFSVGQRSIEGGLEQLHKYFVNNF
jgi:aspartate/methionine/tyrosine aminotransferase